MAGLTKEQRAAKAAQAEQLPVDDGLITGIKGADELRVHPSCVKAHQAAGWAVKE